MRARSKVLIIDDSALVRKMLSAILEPHFDVVGTASDPIIAREKIKKLRPDVLTLDVEMPRMDGLTFLRNLMRLRPMPVVMISSLTEKGAAITLEALEIGAVDFVAKPKLNIGSDLKTLHQEIVDKVQAAALARVRPRHKTLAPPKRHSADAILRQRAITQFDTTDMVLAIGASTGGTEAIRAVVSALPAGMPGTVITQHIPEAFSKGFAARVNQFSHMQVKQAEDGEAILPGHAYIAPGHLHLLVERSGARFLCRLHDGLPVNRHKPSVDVLFRSVAQSAGKNAIGVILTGMGDDGAKGLLEMRSTGAATIAQDEASSVVWGMPGEAVKLGAADDVLSLDRVANRLIFLALGRKAA